MTETKIKEIKLGSRQNGRIPEGWKKFRLSDIVELIGGGTPRTTIAEYWGGEIPWLSVVDFGGGSRWVYKTEKTITQKGLEESSTRTLKKGQLIISARGTVGEIAQLGRDMAFNQSCYGVNGRQDLVINDFLYYLLKVSVNDLKRNTHGAVFDTITRETFEYINVLLPPISEQQAVAKILFAIDAKIDLNRRMNDSLEQMARAIFKQWFVDFEFPGHEKTKFVNDLPEGWREGCFGDILAISIGGDWGEDSKFDGAVQSISLRGTDLGSLKSSGYAPNAPIRWISKDKLEKRVVSNCCILIGGSGLGPIGKTIYCSEQLSALYDFPITYSNFCKCLVAETPALALFAEKNMENMYLSGEMRRFYTGTSIPNLDVNSLMKYPVIIPSKGMVQEFYDIVSLKFAKLFSKESMLLSQARDIFLPKLMSGEIRVNL